MIDRRRFLQCIAAAAAPSGIYGCSSPQSLRGLTPPDPKAYLSLAGGLGYKVVSRAGKKMNDGFVVPEAHDGMAAFNGEDGRIILICNHELEAPSHSRSAFGNYKPDFPNRVFEKFYDPGDGKRPTPGGTTTTIWNPATGKTERQHLSLAGTELNCSGGRTPWKSWLSCEECFVDPGPVEADAPPTRRDKRHGYVFEVPANETALVKAQPIKSMGRFEHEACAVHEASGIVYMTEDRTDSCFYRYIPNVAGKLIEGGRLQALAIIGAPSMKTHNWDNHDIVLNTKMATRWIDLDNVDSDENDLRLRATADGAAIFARGEGLTDADGQFVFTCTTGGPSLLGQVFNYTPSPYEGTPGEIQSPGNLALIAESDRHSILWNPDNLTLAPWGDLLICEDTSRSCGIIGIKPTGEQYEIASNIDSDSELAGICFSPDGKTMFVNIQYPGMTLAITGFENFDRR